ncbi:hypothetical protein ACFLUA_00715 [Chloroflexota bacterium]
MYVATDVNGNYTIDDLPAGTFDVVIDASTLPAGLTNSVDPDGTTDSATTVILAAGEGNTDTNFGYEETDSVTS